MTISFAPIWDSQETKALVESLFGRDQWAIHAYPSVRSLKDRAQFAAYHYFEVKGLLAGYVDVELSGRSMLWVHADPEKFDEFSHLMMRLRAHVTAFFQSLHAMPDICAHMLYYSLGLNRDKDALEEDKISTAAVREMLAGKPDHFCGLHALVCELTRGAGFKRLRAITNTAKHRSIVRSSLSEDQTGSRAERHVLMLETITYQGKTYPESEALLFMQREHDRMQPLMVDIGVSLNAVLRTGSHMGGAPWLNGA